jgi:hypothetical protein
MGTDNLQSLIAAIERESASFDAYVEGQRIFGTALRARDWPGLEKAMAVLEAQAERIMEAEADRAAAETFVRLEFGILEEGLHRIALVAPEPMRSRLLDTHRRLRIGAMRARLENTALGDYAAASRDLLGSVLEELFPEKRGRIYGRSGKAIQPGHDALLLNTAL